MERAGGAPMADTIRCEVSDNVAQITLDDGKVNAMALAFFAGLNAALDRAEHERPGALVIAGRAGVFSAALDLTAYAISKARHRAMAVRWAAEQLETEIAALPSRAAIK